MSSKSTYRAETSHGGDVDRIDQIVKIDTSALLTTIRGLEISLSEYHRQDKVPPWAVALFSRLDRLEQQGPLANQSMRPNSSDQAVSLDSLSQDDRMMNRMRSIVDNELGTTRVSLESKINSLSLELDRLHKLLHIRPTTSEFQQVVLSVNDIQKKMYESLGEISTSIKATVQTKVITEMDSLVEQMKSNERTQLDGIAVAMKKVDSLQDDMKDIKQGVENGVGSMKATVDSVRDETAALREEVQNLKAQRDTDNVAAQYALTEVRFSQDIHRDALSDYKVSVSNSLSRMEQTVQSSEEFLNKLVKDVDEKAARTLTTVMEAKDNIKDFKLLYEFDMEDVKVSVRTVNDTVASFADRVDKIEAYIKPLQEMDSETTLKRLDASLEETLQRLNDMQKTAAETTTQIERVNKSVHALQGEVNARIPDQFSAQAERADKLSEDIQSSEEAIKILDALLKQVQHKIGEFAAVRNDLDLAKETLTQTEQRLKTVHNNMSVVMDSSIEHEKRIEVLTETLEKSEETALHRMEEVKESLLELLTEKQAEIDADVKNLRESLDMATGANDPGGAYDNVGSSSSFVSKGTAPSAGGMTSLSTLPTRSGVGLGVTSVTTSSGQTSTTSTKERQLQMQRLPARGAPRNPAVNVGGVVVTVEDQRVVTQSQAEVMAELCVNLEEIAVQKSMVPELPPSMCEQVTACSQSLTAFMANCSDAEVVQRALRSNPYDVGMEEDNISDNRQLKIDNFVAEVMSLVISQNPQPGIIRLETREKFEKQLRKALTLCMSKHNQVLSVGSTRIGRLKIPACIACDRPLLEKTRIDTVSRAQEGVWAAQRDYDDQPSSSAMSPDHYRSPGRERPAPLRGFDNVKELKLMSKGAGKTQQGQLPPESAFVLRGGFKMPKQGRAMLTLTRNETTTPLPAILSSDEKNQMNASFPGTK